MSDYAKCEKRERDRQRKWRKTEQGRFESSMLHLDFNEAETLEKSPKWLSDKGEGVEAIVRAVDGEPTREERISSARKRLVESAPRLVEVFDLIMENGKNREESIWQLAKRMMRRKRQDRA